MSVLKRACPDDFEATFIAIGRLACERHYGAGKGTITRWLDEAGKVRLIEARKAHVRDQRRLSAKDVGVVLKMAFPVQHSSVSFTLARHAAQFLRVNRNGGWIVSPAKRGWWRLGTRMIPAAELVAFAERKGFVAPRHSRPSANTITCGHCGIEVVPWRKGARYCSRTCRSLARATLSRSAILG